MRVVLLLALAALVVADESLKINVVSKPQECHKQAEDGDYVSVHYTGKLLADGSEFDSSHERGEPIKFTLGHGRVIQGWDQGIKGMCIGEKRTLTIPPELGYGEEGIGPIPGNAWLTFDVELVDVTEAPEGGDEYDHTYEEEEEEAGEEEDEYEGEEAAQWE